jgi:uncharacterized protein with PIN domain
MEIVEVKHFFTNEADQRVYDWEVVSVHEALKMAEPRMRCSECKGEVRLVRTSEDGLVPPHAEHRKRNVGCSLGDRYNGTPKLAEKRVE